MTLLKALPQAIITQIKTTLPALRTCREMEGRFDDGELARVGAATPAVLVARLGATQTRDAPDWPLKGYTLRMAAFVLSKPTLTGPASDHLSVIVEAILGLLVEATWGLENVGEARNIGEAPIVTQKTRSAQVLISAITWDQPVVLAAPTPSNPIPVELYVAQSPTIGPDHLGSYEQIGGGA